MSSVHRHPRSPYWQASFKTWKSDPNLPDGGSWGRSYKSTGIPTSEPESAAQRVADAFEDVGTSAAPENAYRQSATFYRDAVASILRAAGVDVPRASISWADYAKTWLAEKKAENATATWMRYRTHIAHMERHLGKRADDPLAKITHQDCQALYQRMLDEGRATRTAGGIVKTVSSVLERAHLLGYIDSNPAKLVKKIKGDARGYKRKPFTPADIKAIFAYLERRNLDEWKLACTLGYYYGMRLRDATGLSTENVDLRRNAITFTPNKTGKTIQLPLIGPLKALTRAAMPVGGGLLTPGLNACSKLSTRFMEILEAAGVEFETVAPSGEAGHALRDKSFHSWRHSAASNLQNAGVENRLADLVLDHRDEHVAKGYTHGDLQAMRKALAAIPAP